MLPLALLALVASTSNASELMRWVWTPKDGCQPIGEPTPLDAIATAVGKDGARMRVRDLGGGLYGIELPDQESAMLVSESASACLKLPKPKG